MVGKLTKVEGILPSVCVVYTDETCKTLDLDACREHMKYLLKHDIGALVTGGHAGETECLTHEEQLAVLKIAVEEAKGRVPVVGGIIADSTWKAIELGKALLNAGADAALFCPPLIVGHDPFTAGRFLVEHYSRFAKQCDIPIILFGAPRPGTTYNITSHTFKQIVKETETVVGAKVTTEGNVGMFVDAMRAMKEIRDVGVLVAGSGHLFASLVFGGDGALTGSSNYIVEEETAMYQAIKAEDLNKAREISDNITPITDAVYGVRVGFSFTYFHYRYKIASWLLGHIPRPHMRLPQLPPPKSEVEKIRDALVKAGKKVVHEAKEFPISST